ncbi:MAG: hypothetical protein GPJ54_07950 [Candidatus Heimdallarchaeota archaeon]|nr:hypothetical protein [Candidatus Heimdallarchaeota archaeon]
MDVFEQLEKLWVQGLDHQISELLEKNKKSIYPPDYFNWVSLMKSGSSRPTPIMAKEWRQSIKENDILQLLYYNVGNDSTDIYTKVNYFLNSPPKNEELLRDKLSKILLDKIDLWDKILEEVNNFDISVTQEDEFEHFDWSKPMWKNFIKVQQCEIRATYHFLILEPEKMIQLGIKMVALCTGELENSLLKARMMNNLAIYYRIVNDIDNNREIRISLLYWLENFIKIHGYAPKRADGSLNYALIYTFHVLGSLDLLEGNLIQAERHFQKYLRYSQAGLAHIILARFYIEFGELEKADYHLEKSLKDDKRDAVEVLKPQYFIEKARLNILKGKTSTSEINIVIELIEKHLELNDFITSKPTIVTFLRVADYYLSTSDLVKAKKYYIKVSEMSKIVYFHDFQSAESLMKLIVISCIEGEDPELFKNELYGLIADYSSHEKMVLYKKLAEGIILMYTKGKQRGSSRFKALDIFEKISQGKIYDINLHFFARFNYCELLLDAYQFYEEEETLEILVNEVEDLWLLSKEKGLIYYYIEVLILRSKIATLHKDLDSALEFLEEAQTLADERNLKIYQNRITSEKETYLQNLDSWNSMMNYDKIKTLKLKQYLKYAQQNITK